MDEALAMQIDGLRKLKTKALKARYRSCLEKNHGLRITPTCFGGSPGACRRRLKEI